MRPQTWTTSSFSPHTEQQDWRTEQNEPEKVVPLMMDGWTEEKEFQTDGDKVDKLEDRL